MNLLLTTRTQTDEYTQSLLRVGETVFHTIERPWIHTPDHKGGANNISCVPGGRYTLIPHDSHRFGRTWALVNSDLDVYHYPQDDKSGRYAILLHSANRAADVEGCIGVGMTSTEGWVGSSKKAMRVLRQILPWVEHTINIVRHPHRGTAV